MVETAWGRAPNPEPNSVTTAEKFLEAVKQGRVRAFAIVTVDPLHDFDTAAVGDLTRINRAVLIGGLSSVAQELVDGMTQENNNHSA